MIVRFFFIGRGPRRKVCGSVFLEAAIVIPVVLAFVAFIFDMGSWLYARGILADSAALAARRAAVEIADFLDKNPVTPGSEQKTDVGDGGVRLYKCSIVARWGQAFSEEVIQRRLGTKDGVRTVMSFSSAAFQPSVTVRVRRTYKCLWCTGFLNGVVTSESTALVEDTDMIRCPDGSSIADESCDPRTNEGFQCR